MITTFFPEHDGESGGEVGMAAAASASGGTGGHGKLVRTYRKQGDKFVLAEVDLTSETRTEAAVFASRTTLKVEKVKWKENKDKDKKRKEERVKRGGKAPKAPNPFAPGEFTVTSSECPPYAVVCDDDPPPGGGNPPSGSGQNVVFQHGIFSGPHTWNRMDPWLSSEFRFGAKLKPDTGSESGLGVQASRLQTHIDNSGQSAFLLVGHSQGGLISREVAKRYVAAGQAHKVTGVITIGTPHHGANLAMRLFGNCWSKYASAGCWIADQIVGAAIPVVTRYALDQTVPASGDLRPGSPFIHQLNGGPEPFTRVGIQSYADKRFVLMRLLGDNFRAIRRMPLVDAPSRATRSGRTTASGHAAS